MLVTISDLLQQIMDKQKFFLDSQKITHPGTIGDMFEGLSKTLLDKALFKGLNLNIRDGFIRDKKGNLSKQIDCMIIEGEGEQIPCTSHCIVDFENVIAILESKKSLLSEELSEAYENMISSSNCFEPSEKMNIQIQDLVQSFQEVTGNEFPKSREELNNLDTFSFYYYHTLVIMHAMPLRIVLGYFGYKSEKSLREGYVNYLEKNINKKNYGPNSMPDLIICNKSSIVKLNDLPFKPQKLDNGYFTLFATGSNVPMYYLVSMLWSKLQYRYNLDPSIWDDDGYSVEPMKAYINTKFVEYNIEGTNRKGWGFQYIPLSDEELDKNLEINWSPFKVSKEAFIVATFFKEADVIENITKCGIPSEILNKVLKELLDTKLFLLDGNKMICNAKDLVLFMNNDSNYLCDNIDGDLNIWLKENPLFS